MKKLKKIREAYPISTFRVVDVSGEPHHKNINIIYQVSGKSTIASEKPEKLIHELMQIRGFSREDGILIYNLLMAEKCVPDFRILSIQFESDPVKFEIEDVRSKYTLLLAAEEIVASRNTVEKLSHDDLAMVYFQLLKENEATQKYLKEQHQKISQYEASGIYFLKNAGENE